MPLSAKYTIKMSVLLPNITEIHNSLLPLTLIPSRTVTAKLPGIPLKTAEWLSGAALLATTTFRRQPVARVPATPAGPRRSLTCSCSAVRSAVRLLRVLIPVVAVRGGRRLSLLAADGGLGTLPPHRGCGRREPGVGSAPRLAAEAPRPQDGLRPYPTPTRQRVPRPR